MQATHVSCHGPTIPGADIMTPGLKTEMAGAIRNARDTAAAFSMVAVEDFMVAAGMEEAAVGMGVVNQLPKH